MTIVFYELAFTDDGVRRRKWQEIAGKLGIPIVEDPELMDARRRMELAKVAAEFLIDD